MPFNGSGTFSRLYNWITDRNAGVKIRAERMDAEFDGIATALSTTMLRNGTSTATANLPMGGFRLTNLGNTKPTATTGTSTAYVLTSGESLSDANVYDGVTVVIRPHTASGATPTIAVDTMTARAIRRQDGNQIGANELVADSTYVLTYRASNTSWYVQGAAIPTITGKALQVLRVNSGANALEFAVSGGITRIARTSNTVLSPSENGAFIDITSGTFTQTFNACATLGASWFCYIRNSGTGDITLDPDGAETIDGRSSYIMYPGEVRLIQCDGTALRSIVLTAFSRTFTSSATFTAPPGYTSYSGLLWGAGASGGRSDPGVSYAAGGGGGGACVPFTLPVAEFSTSTSVTIGAGGTAVSAVGTNGVAGGNSSITLANGNDIAASGGAAGNGGSGTGGAGGSGRVPGAQLSASTTADGLAGGSGGSSAVGSNSAYGGAGGGGQNFAGGNSIFGGAGGGGAFGGSNEPAGGTSVLGGAGGKGGPSAVAGSAPGGGGGASGNGTSGAGARGELRIWGVV